MRVWRLAERRIALGSEAGGVCFFYHSLNSFCLCVLLIKRKPNFVFVFVASTYLFFFEKRNGSQATFFLFCFSRVAVCAKQRTERLNGVPLLGVKQLSSWRSRSEGEKVIVYTYVMRSRR